VNARERSEQGKMILGIKSSAFTCIHIESLKKDKIEKNTRNRSICGQRKTTFYGSPPVKQPQIWIERAYDPSTFIVIKSHTGERWYPFRSYALTGKGSRTPLGNAVPG